MTAAHDRRVTTGNVVLAAFPAPPVRQATELSAEIVAEIELNLRMVGRGPIAEGAVDRIRALVGLLASMPRPRGPARR